MAAPKKRVNKNKEELAQLAAHKADIERQKSLIRAIWPDITKDLTIYDAQTVVNALGGFIKFELERKQDEIKVADLAIDVANEKDEKLRTAMEAVLKVFNDQKAFDGAQLLERLGKTLGMYSAHMYMKGNMDTLKVEDIVA